jgi:hypothetical protein
MRVASDVEKQFPGVHVAITGGHRMSVDNATIIRARCDAVHRHRFGGDDRVVFRGVSAAVAGADCRFCRRCSEH